MLLALKKNKCIFLKSWIWKKKKDKKVCQMKENLVAYLFPFDTKNLSLQMLMGNQEYVTLV